MALPKGEFKGRASAQETPPSFLDTAHRSLRWQFIKRGLRDDYQPHCILVRGGHMWFLSYLLGELIKIRPYSDEIDHI